MTMDPGCAAPERNGGALPAAAAGRKRRRQSRPMRNPAGVSMRMGGASGGSSGEGARVSGVGASPPPGTAAERRPRRKCGASLRESGEFGYLCGVNFNRHITQAEFSGLAEFFRAEGCERRFVRGECLSEQGLRTHRAGLVVQGAFRYVHVADADREHVVGYAFAGEFVGDYISMRVDAPSQVTIEAMCDAAALVVTAGRLETFFRTDAAHERLGRTLAEHLLAEVYERLLDRYAVPPQQRYEALLKRCPDLLQLVSLRELASWLGVRPETLSRIRGRIR